MHTHSLQANHLSLRQKSEPATQIRACDTDAYSAEKLRLRGMASSSAADAAAAAVDELFPNERNARAKGRSAKSLLLVLLLRLRPCLVASPWMLANDTARCAPFFLSCVTRSQAPPPS